MTNLWEKHKASGWTAFDSYRVAARIKNIVGGKPATEDMIEKWVNATCKAKTAEERAKIRDAHVGTLPDMAEEKADAQTVVFARLPNGELAIEGRQIKAMLKESANIIKDIVPGGKDGEAGQKALKSKVADQVFVVEEHVPLGVTEPTRREQRPIHVMTAQGPRTSIKRSEIVEGAEIQFTVKRRSGPGLGVSEKALLGILDYAQTVGLGADRSQGFGQFEIVSVEKI